MEMIEIEKLIKALVQHCDNYADCKSCPYDELETSIKCRDSLLCDCLEALKQSQWISVKDRLPNEDGTMRGYLVDIGMCVGIMPFFNGKFREGLKWKEPEYPVHHWTPLPEPPEEK